MKSNGNSRLDQATGFLNPNNPDTINLRRDLLRAFPDGDRSYGYRPGRAIHYQPLPLGSHAKRWGLPRRLLELHGLKTNSLPAIGIDLLGDIVIGIDRQDGCAPDLDLGPYGADLHGVSRRHALLRATANKLYLTDLYSTNGTMHNARLLLPGKVAELRNGDIITFGSLSFTVTPIP